MMHRLLLLLVFLGVWTLHAQDVYFRGGLVRLDPSERKVMLVFTADSWNDGTDDVLRTLKRRHVRAAFFLTGRFFERYPDDVRRLRRAHHYVGSHGYAHLLYSDWARPDSMLVTRQQFCEDMALSYELMAKADIDTTRARWFMPAYEHYNDTVSRWASEIGLHLINYTPGSSSNADYTIPSMKSYRSSDSIYRRILEVEEKEGLNGHILLFHLGTHPERTDKFYTRHLDLLIRELRRRGYRFRRLKG